MKRNEKDGWIDKGSNIDGAVGIAVCDGYDCFVGQGTGDI